MRTRIASLGLIITAGFLAACNSNGIVAGGSAPTPTATLTPTPTASPTATPDACQFYGIDAGSNLWEIDPVNVTAHMVGPTGKSGLTDIAITPDNRIIAMTLTGGYQLDPSTGHATQIAGAAWLTGQDALDAMPDGRLLVGGGAKLVAVDIDTGAQTTVGSISGGRVFSGDVASNGATGALGTAKVTSGTANDHLVSFDIATHTVTDRGDLGYPKVYGLDYGCDGNLYGMIATSPPKLLKVNPTTGATTMLGTMTGGPSTLWGAAGPALP
jgi:hypothetical protein